MTYSVPIRLRRLAAAEVAQGPGSVAQHAQLPAIVDEVQQRTQSTGVENEVTALRAVTRNVTKGPDGLLTNIGFRAAQEFAEDRYSTSLDNNLGLLGGTRGNVGQSPSSFELNKSVGGSEEFNEAAHDTGLDDTLNGGVALLGEQFPELGGGLDLLVDLIGEDALNHLGELHIKLENHPLAILHSNEYILAEREGSLHDAGRVLVQSEPNEGSPGGKAVKSSRWDASGQARATRKKDSKTGSRWAQLPVGKGTKRSNNEIQTKKKCRNCIPHSRWRWPHHHSRQLRRRPRQCRHRGSGYLSSWPNSHLSSAF